MKPVHRLGLLLTIVLSLTASATFGSAFSYSYLFGDGLSVTGTLDGTQNGNFVDNVTNVTVFFNGVQMPGTVFTAKYDGVDYLNGPVVSFDALQNNFVFINSDVVNGGFSYDSFFYILNASVTIGDVAVGYSTPLSLFGSTDFPTLVRNWTLAPVVTAIPDGGITITLLGLALVGLVWCRRAMRRSAVS